MGKVSNMRLKDFNTLSVQRMLFLDAVKKLPLHSQKIIVRALNLSERAHGVQLRDDGALYVIHPIRVALSLLREFGHTSPTLLIAALMHDTVEDCSVSLALIRRVYGKRVAEIVKDVTDARPAHETEKQKTIRKHTKLKFILIRARASRIIKCADLLDNVRSWPLLSLKSLSRKKIPRWLKEASISYFPLARATDMRMYRAIKKAVAAASEKL